MKKNIGRLFKWAWKVLKREGGKKAKSKIEEVLEKPFEQIDEKGLPRSQRKQGRR